MKFVVLIICVVQQYLLQLNDYSPEFVTALGVVVHCRSRQSPFVGREQWLE